MLAQVLPEEISAIPSKKGQKKKYLPCHRNERENTLSGRIKIENGLFCDNGQEEGDLLLVSTFEADANFLPTMIVGLQDIQLLSWIECGDLIARDVKYHLN